MSRLTGLGPLTDLLADPTISEIMVNGPGPVRVERGGEISPAGLDLDLPTLEHVLERIVAPLGRRLDRTSPMVDGRLADGSRVHAVIPPVALDGPCLTIRRFGVRAVDLDQVADPADADALRHAVAERRNIVVSGATSTGKTTMLNTLASMIPPSQRVVTIEDAAELDLGLPDVVRLEARPPMVDGPPEITVRDLVRNALRMRPDRLVVGEVRGAEALDMVQALNTGHEGSLSTVHANSATDAIERLESMVVMAGAGVDPAMAGRLVSMAVDVVVHLVRTGDGERRVGEIVRCGAP